MSVPNAFALLSSEPGIRIDDNGVSHVAVLFSRDRAARHLGLVEAEFSPDGRPRGAPAAHDLGEFAAPLRAATVQFSLDAKTATACYWIAVLTNEQLAKGSDHEGPETIRPRFRPAFPLELYPLGDGTFVLTVDDHGPHLTFLP